MKSGAGIVVSALAVAAAAGCGHRGPIAPPLPRWPNPPQEVGWRQRGERLEVNAKYQLLGLEGRRLRPPVRADVLRVTPKNAGDMAGWDTPAREHEFARTATPVALAGFAAADLGQTVVKTDDLALAQLGPPGPAVLALVVQDKSARSTLSPRVTLIPAVPPLAPLAVFEAAPEEKGVRLRWRAADDARVHVVRIYRWKEGAAAPWTPWRVAPAADGQTFDDAAQYGDDLNYEATAARDEKDVPVESSPVRVPLVAYRDVFPPAPPRDLDAVAETGRIRVLWRPGGSPDEAATIVERQEEGEEAFRRVATVETPDSFFTDADVKPERRYRYRLIAVDKLGNQTAPVGPTEWVSSRPAP